MKRIMKLLGLFLALSLILTSCSNTDGESSEESAVDSSGSVEVTDDAKKWIADEAYEPQFGARPLKRFIQRYIETPLARKMIESDLIEGQNFKVDYADGEVKFETV